MRPHLLSCSPFLLGAPVTTFIPVGTSGYIVARPALSNSGNGIHSISATAPVGISVYGYGTITSFWYPGGTNVTETD